MDSDLPLIRSKEAVIMKRPRGILSGFLVVVPGGRGAWVLGTEDPVPVRMRLIEEVRRGGFIASAYFHKGDYVVNDMLVWKDEPSFYCKTFPERWAYVQEFFRALRPDSVLQGGRLVPASYTIPSAVESVEGVTEWVPFSSNQKRLIFVPERIVSPKAATVPPKAAASATAKNTVAPPVLPSKRPTDSEPVFARRDPAGPDVYQLWRGKFHLGQALVRTLAVSKALRTAAPSDLGLPVSVELNKAFAKWEITGLVAPLEGNEQKK